MVVRLVRRANWAWYARASSRAVSVSRRDGSFAKTRLVLCRARAQGLGIFHVRLVFGFFLRWSAFDRLFHAYFQAGDEGKS